MKRILNLIMSDLHLDNKTLKKRTGDKDYLFKQARRRMAHVVREAQTYKLDHRRETSLRVWLLGDIGHGDIHRGGARLSDGLTFQIDTIQSAIARLRESFGGDRTRVLCVTGNHGRFVHQSPGLQADDKSDSYETIVYNQLRKVCVDVVIPETAYVDDREFGWRFLATHGDTMFKLPNPGNSINLARIEQKINRWTASRWRPDVVMLGHHHVATIQQLAAGNMLIVNGSLQPSDEYTVSIDFPSAPSAQVMFETTEDHPVGDLRIIHLDKHVDNDRSLDLILPKGGLQ